jgi:hypothetical protein
MYTPIIFDILHYAHTDHVFCVCFPTTHDQAS